MEKNNNSNHEVKTPADKQVDNELWFSALAADDASEYDAKQAFGRFLHRTSQAQKPIRVPLFRSWMYGTVAAVLLVLVAISAYWQGGRQMENNFANIVVEVPLGSKSKMQLPDGTTVWLNAGSRMAYSQGFGVNNRQVEFQGEGFFEVERNEKLPFNIRTADVNLTVLGTKFNFRNYPDDDEVVVDLQEGSVSLENQLKEMNLCYLSPTEKMVLNRKTGDMLVLKAETEKSNHWVDHLLLFDEDLLPDIARELERSYDVEITIATPALKKARFYGHFNQRKQTIQQVLDILSATGQMDYEITDRQILLK